MNTCSNCKWWKYWLTVQSVGEYGTEFERLGHCEMVQGVPTGPLMVGMEMSKATFKNHGLTAENYSCGKHRERE